MAVNAQANGVNGGSQSRSVVQFWFRPVVFFCGKYRGQQFPQQPLPVASENGRFGTMRQAWRPIGRESWKSAFAVDFAPPVSDLAAYRCLRDVAPSNFVGKVSFLKAFAICMDGLRIKSGCLRDWTICSGRFKAVYVNVRTLVATSRQDCRLHPCYSKDETLREFRDIPVDCFRKLLVDLFAVFGTTSLEEISVFAPPTPCSTDIYHFSCLRRAVRPFSFSWCGRMEVAAIGVSGDRQGRPLDSDSCRGDRVAGRNRSQTAC